MKYNSFDLRRLAPALGAEIEGLDLSKPLSDQAVKDVKQAWLDHQVLFFRNQTVTPEQFESFGKLFGDIETYPFMANRAEDRSSVEKLDLNNTPPQAPPTTVLHIDVSSFEVPTKAALLYAVEVPEAGHDTIWASAYAAYDALSEPMKEFLAVRRALFLSLDIVTRDKFMKAGAEGPDKFARFIKVPPHEHPIVHTHPDTGKKALFVDPLRMWSITDLAWTESEALLGFLSQHIAQPEFQCRYHWQPGTIAVWDNRCTLHKRVGDPVAAGRVMHRLPIAGEAPPVP